MELIEEIQRATHDFLILQQYIASLQNLKFTSNRDVYSSTHDSDPQSSTPAKHEHEKNEEESEQSKEQQQQHDGDENQITNSPNNNDHHESV